MKKCANCGVKYEIGIGSNFCSNSCRISNYKKFRAEVRYMYRKIYRKYFK